VSPPSAPGSGVRAFHLRPARDAERTLSGGSTDGPPQRRLRRRAEPVGRVSVSLAQRAVRVNRGNRHFNRAGPWHEIARCTGARAMCAAAARGMPGGSQVPRQSPREAAPMGRGHRRRGRLHRRGCTRGLVANPLPTSMTAGRLEAPRLRSTAPWRSARGLAVGCHPTAVALHPIAISSVNPSNFVPGTPPIESPNPPAGPVRHHADHVPHVVLGVLMRAGSPAPVRRRGLKPDCFDTS
jgi:hypothetical protein